MAIRSASIFNVFAGDRLRRKIFEGVLIYCIHHIAMSIRGETLLEKLTFECCAAVDRLFPERLGLEENEDDGRLRQVQPAHWGRFVRFRPEYRHECADAHGM
jgi:hypothetical protein